MKIVLNNYFTYESLMNIFEKYIHKNTAIGLDNITYRTFEDNLTEEFEIIQRKTNNLSYEFTPYKEKLILKDRYSTPRIISIPTLRDKVVLKAIHLYLSDKFANIHQPIPQTCIREIKSNINKYDSFIKLDIAKYYDSVSHGILYQKLNNPFDNYIEKNELELIKKAITNPTKTHGETLLKFINHEGIPQGIAISNILSSIFLKDLDKKYSEMQDILFIRYVDDIIILCNQKDINSIYDSISYDLEAVNNLDINEKKSHRGPLEDGFDFLGYTIFKERNKFILTVKKDNRNRFEDSIVKIFSQKKYSNKMTNEQFLFLLNNKITGSISKKVSGNLTREYNYGWLFYYSQVNDTKYLYHLDWFIKNLIKKFDFQEINQNMIKSFVKTFYEIKYNYEETTYIFRPDNLDHIQRKTLLINTFGVPTETLTSSNMIRKLYYKLVYRPILEYEKDIKKWIS